ncbi:MAG: GPW/gp25 family protein [Lachnospiraceae bacterium]|nr:GPW/gp25 family protein [Lachnospiraceae bacterium]
MEYIIDMEGAFDETEFKDIKRCLETLLSIRAGSQPLDRELGIAYENTVDKPLNIAQNALSLEIIEKVERYEPRVTVKEITYDEADYKNGQIKPHIYFKKTEN